MKTFIYHIQEGYSTNIMEIERLEGLKLIGKLPTFDLGLMTSDSYGTCIKVFRYYAPYKKVDNLQDLLLIRSNRYKAKKCEE